jgi:hypothetical protein
VPELLFPDPPLADAVVLLRAWRSEDLPSLTMGFAAPTVQRFSWTRAAEYTEADARSFFHHQEETRICGEKLNFASLSPATQT